MAKLRVYRSIDNSVWKLTFVNDPEALSENDKKLMRNFGEPEINLGGTFLDSTENEYTLPEKHVRVRTDFPFTQSFDAKDTVFLENTETKVEAFETEIVSRFTLAFTTLRENDDTFNGEAIYNV
jgi:hypothetical protein